jgi:hypothetical protein
MTDDKQPDANDYAFALIEHVNRFAKITPTMAEWQNGVDAPTEEQVSAARAIIRGGKELRESLWALETLSETVVKSFDDAQEKRLDAFFEDPIEGV